MSTAIDTIAFILFNGVGELDDIFFATMKIIGLALIIWTAKQLSR